MKRILFIILLLSLLLAATNFPVSVRAQSDCANSSCTAKMSRVISTSLWGATVMNDTVTLSQANATVSHISIGWPGNIGSNLKNVTAVDNNNAGLTVSKLSPTTPQGQNYTAFDVALPTQRVLPYKFTVSSVFTGLLSYNQSATNQFSLSFSPFPVTNFNVSEATLLVKTGDWTSPSAKGVTGTFGTGSFNANQIPLRAFNLTVAQISFNSATQQLLDATAERTIRISPSAEALVTDSYTATNKGPKMPFWSIPIPKDSTFISASDGLGPLPDTCASAKCVDVSQESNRTSLRITPRFGAVNTGGSVELSIEYKLGPNFLSSTGPGRYKLNYSLFDNVQFYAPSLTTRIITPSGFTLESLDSPLKPTANGNEMVFHVTPVSPASNLSFSMTYRLSPFWASLTPLGWILLLEVAVVFGVLVFRTGSSTVLVTGRGPSEAMKRFVSLYDERSSLRREGDRIEEDMARGALNRHEYKRRRRLIDIRMAEIDRSLVPVKAQLSDTGSRYQEMMRRVNRAEADLQAVRASLADMRNQYRAGRLNKDLYESMMSDLLRRKERAQQTIDNVVITVREEIR